MDTFETIKKFLTEGGKCLLVENGKPIGVVLTMEEYDKLKSEIRDTKSETKIEKLPIPKIENEPIANPIGDAMVKEMDFSQASAEPVDIALADDVTLEDLGLDELPY